MAPRSTRGRGVRAILMGVVFTLGAMSLAAQAAAPQIRPETLTVKSGWSKSNKTVGAEFTVRLAPASKVTIKDLSTGLDVAGQTVFEDQDAGTPGVQHGDGIGFLATGTMVADGRNYEVTFEVLPFDGSTTTPATYSKIFKVDTLVPAAPRITAPTGPTVRGDSLCSSCIDATTTLALEPGDAIVGSALDQHDRNAADPAAARSGVAAVELRFYSVTDQAMNAIFSGLEDAGDAAFRVKLPQTCGTSCPATVDEWSQAFADLEDLTPGPWTVRAVAIDLAGNESAPSKAVTFIWS